MYISLRKLGSQHSLVAGTLVTWIISDLHTKAMALFISVKGDLLAIEYHDGLSGLCILV